LLEILPSLADKYSFAEIIPISAIKNDNIERLLNTSKTYLPESEFHYAEEFLTDRDMRFLVAEVIRESAFVYLEKELPYATHVEIEKYSDEGDLAQIAAVIYVEKESQKSILIGKQGDMLKKIGTRARKSIQQQLGVKAHLELWVKLHKDWQDNPNIVGKYEL
jgi:GTP-binding protein Era